MAMRAFGALNSEAPKIGSHRALFLKQHYPSLGSVEAGRLVLLEVSGESRGPG